MIFNDAELNAIADAIAARVAERLAAQPTPLMTTVEAAEYLAAGRQTLEIWRCKGGGPKYVKIGAAVRYRRADLDEFVAQRQQKHTARCGT